MKIRLLCALLLAACPLSYAQVQIGNGGSVVVQSSSSAASNAAILTNTTPQTFQGPLTVPTVTGNLVGNVNGTVTGHSTLDLPLTGGTLNGTLSFTLASQALATLTNLGGLSLSQTAPQSMSGQLNAPAFNASSSFSLGGNLIFGTNILGSVGTGPYVQLANGTVAPGHCYQADSNGNASDAGAPCGSGGGGSVSGQASGYIPLATGSSTIGAQSHINDGVSTPGTITANEPVSVTSGTPGVGNNGTWWTTGSGAPSGSCTAGFYTNSTATSINTAMYFCISGAWVAMTASGGGSSETPGNLAELDFDGSDTGSVTYTGLTSTTSAPYTSPASMITSANGQYGTVTVAAQTAFYGRAYIKINATSTAAATLFDFFNGTSEVGNIYLTTAGYLSFYNNTTAASTPCETSAFPTGSYHLVEWAWSWGASGTFTAKIDGTQTCSATLNTGSQTVNTIKFGQLNNSGSAWTLQYDNVGLSNTGWMGSVTP